MEVKLFSSHKEPDDGVEIVTSYTKNSPLDRRMGRTSLQIVEVNGMQLRYPKPSHVS